MIGKLLKGLVKTIVGKSADKTGLNPGTGKKIIDIAEDLITNDPEIKKEVQDFILAFEGQYSELKTRSEGIVRSMLRPFLTVFFAVNTIIFIYMKIPIPDIIFWADVLLIGSWCGTKGARDFNKFLKKKKKLE